MEFNVKQFLKSVGAKVLQKGTAEICAGISTDSRTIQSGQLFFALKGPNFDGARFCEEISKKNAWGIVVQNPTVKIRNPNTWIFQVADPLKALGDVARWWRSQFKIPIVAITGSNGKTTTKEMAASIFAQKWNVLKTEGNFNNLIGLPLTLSRLTAHHTAAVLEMGMNEVGEIRRLTEIAGPGVGVVTNAAAAHLEKLQTVEAVARAKCELYEMIPATAVAVYNAEDPWLAKLVQNFRGKKISFGMRPGCDVRFEHMECIGFDFMELKMTVQGTLLKTRLKTAGIHNVMNAMAACAAAIELGLPVDIMAAGLSNFEPVKMRFEQIQLANGVRLVNDAYNANPLSMAAAFKTVNRAKRAGRFIAVLGDMKELGERSPELHWEVGKNAVENGVEKLFVLGEFASHLAKGAREAGLKLGQIIEAKNPDEVADLLENEMIAGDIVLIKASRAMRLETIVEELKERFGI